MYIWENPERRIMRRQKLKTKVHLCVLLGEGMMGQKVVPTQSYVSGMEMAMGIGTAWYGSENRSRGQSTKIPKTRKGKLVSIHLTWSILDGVPSGSGHVLVCEFHNAISHL